MNLMSRADRLEEALRQIATLSGLDSSQYKIAQAALDADAPRVDPIHYRSDKDYEAAYAWMQQHRKADQLVFDTSSGRGIPVAAIYIEPVADYYEDGRRVFRRIAEQLRADRYDDGNWMRDDDV
jgi:hypothetical protein